MMRIQMNRRPNRAVTRWIIGALAAATLLVAVVVAGGAELNTNRNAGEEIPSRSARIERLAASGPILPDR